MYLRHTSAKFLQPAWHWTKLFLCYLPIFLVSAWAVLALYVDFNLPKLKIIAAVIYLAALIIVMLRWRRLRQRLLASILGFCIVLLWWLSLSPSNEGQWQADVSRTAFAELNGTQITFHNVRSCDYRAELDYDCQWLDRQIDLNQVQGIDIFLDYWGSPLIAHTIVSFEVGPVITLSDGRSLHDRQKPQPIAFSVEARKQTGQSYSSILGFFRKYTLISVVSDERDLVRLRTNYRRGEDLYLYHTRATPEFARDLLLNYVTFTNHIHDHPQWYNALTRNCTTEVFSFKTLKTRPLDWRILLNGKSDEMLYDQGELATELPGQPSSSNPMSFEELKRRAYINPAANAANLDPAFSERIREGRPGFASQR